MGTGDVLTDEQFGRAWAGQMGKRPDHVRNSKRFPGLGLADLWAWRGERRYAEMGIKPSRACVPAPVESCWGDWWVLGGAAYDTEELAYAALGAAVRAVHEAVPPLKENADGQG